jgi:hypothetical protein
MIRCCCPQKGAHYSCAYPASSPAQFPVLVSPSYLLNNNHAPRSDTAGK